MANPKIHKNSSNKFLNFLSYVWSNNTDNFYYNIGGYDYTLDELKHGLLRGNKKKPGSFFRTLGKRDERALVLDGLSDPKILFLCFDLPEIPIHIECFDDPDTLDEKFDTFLAEYFKTKVEIDTLNGEITIPYQFEYYQEDFGGTIDFCLKYIWEWFNNCEFDVDEITNLVNKKALSIKYSEQFQ